jgi:hypothetical protein
MSDCAPSQPPELAPGVAGRSSSPSPGSATGVAHAWLKKQCEDVNGHMSTWTTETMDSYHRDLGLLVDFVTDCWPNAPGERRGELPRT